MSRRETEILRLLGEGNLDPEQTLNLIDELEELESRKVTIRINGKQPEEE